MPDQDLLHKPTNSFEQVNLAGSHPRGLSDYSLVKEQNTHGCNRRLSHSQLIASPILGRRILATVQLLSTARLDFFHQSSQTAYTPGKRQKFVSIDLLDEQANRHRRSTTAGLMASLLEVFTYKQLSACDPLPAVQAPLQSQPGRTTSNEAYYGQVLPCRQVSALQKTQAIGNRLTVQHFRDVYTLGKE